MADTPDMQMQLVSSHGMLAILEVLEGKCSRDVIMKLLQIINAVSGLRLPSGGPILNPSKVGHRRCRVPGKFLFDWVSKSPIPVGLLTKGYVIYVSGIPVMMGTLLMINHFRRSLICDQCVGFTSKRYPSECRLEASNFIRLLCNTSVLTLQMFIS